MSSIFPIFVTILIVSLQVCLDPCYPHFSVCYIHDANRAAFTLLVPEHVRCELKSETRGLACEIRIEWIVTLLK